MKKQTILITGASGLVGSSFIEGVVSNKFITLVRPPHDQMDISKESSVKKIIEEYKPDTVINFAAHRNANTAEDQYNDKTASAWMANVVGAKNLAELSDRYGIYLIHISTDMVFGGYKTRKGPYLENDTPESSLEKLSWYGWTKRLAEKEILSKKINASIVRIGNVTKPIYNPNLDYIGKILWLYDRDKLYPLFDDQQITLTHIPELTLSIVKLIESKLNGVYHVASSDLVTPFQLAEYLLRKARFKEDFVKRTSIDEFLKKTPNRYPKFGGLKSQLTQKKLGIKFMSWQEIVDDFIKHAL